MNNSFRIFFVCALGLILITPVYNAPKHRYRDHSSSTKFDQKQTGDYNVQLHLKDFHIFALMGDDGWGGLGDYDYNYDYSDLTIKPISSTVTSEKPLEASSTAPEASSVEITTQKLIESSVISESTSQSSSTTLKPSSEPSSTETPLVSSTLKIEKTTKIEPVTNVSLIPVKIVQDSVLDHSVPLGEILHYRKCVDGFSKDSQGRCRKIIRKNSQLPIHTININPFLVNIYEKIIMGTVLFITITLFVIAHSSPIPGKLKYDQRQEGKWNVRADLENFLIFIIPTSNSGSGSSSSNASLLDFLSKSIPLPHKRNRGHNNKFADLGEKISTEEFIESKTAPYHVDISRTRSHLAKLHPDVNIPEGVIIAQSPSVALAKHPEEAIRSSRAFVVKVPVDNQNVHIYNDKESKNEVLSNKGDGEKPQLTIEYSQLTPELKTAYAKVLANVIKEGLVQYFRTVAENLKRKNKEEELKDEEEDATDLPLKIHKEENKKKLEKPLKKKKDLTSELEPPKINAEEDYSKENSAHAVH
ncbi:hypothetical protein FQR65_LT03433 [Abscondita terminalis]|nr:hypothetical protein FQR65_LT03433 [Abscondita terminalis]